MLMLTSLSTFARTHRADVLQAASSAFQVDVPIDVRRVLAV